MKHKITNAVSFAALFLLYIQYRIICAPAFWLGMPKFETWLSYESYDVTGAPVAGMNELIARSLRIMFFVWSNCLLLWASLAFLHSCIPYIVLQVWTTVGFYVYQGVKRRKK